MTANSFLPACEPAGEPLQSQTNPLHRILVVDDDGDLRRLNTEVLIHAGYEVDAAADGAAAWEELQLNAYDLLITDNNMPRLSGVELLEKLRAARMLLPVIVASGTFIPQQSAPWLKPDATLLKPYTLEELVRTVRKVLREVDSAAQLPLFASRELQDPKPSPVGESTNAARPLSKQAVHRILVVDEDRDLRQMYSEALADPDYHIDLVADGLAGWEAIQTNRYQLLITEHDLPKLTGVELVRKLRAAHMALPVVMAAGRLPTYELARSPALQLAATLVKPFAVELLRDTVRNVLRATTSPPETMAPPNWQRQSSAGLR